MFRYTCTQQPCNPDVSVKRQTKYLCRVCGDIANGIHFGVHTCEGCKKFFRRCLLENSTLICKARKSCHIDIKTRNTCRLCRYLKCLAVGMSRNAIKMGRPRNNTLTSILEKQESKTNADLPTMGMPLFTQNCTPNNVPHNRPGNFLLDDPVDPADTVNGKEVPTYTEPDCLHNIYQRLRPSLRSRSLGNIHHCMSRNYQCPWSMPQQNNVSPIKINPWNDIEGNRTLLYKSSDFTSMPDLRALANNQSLSRTVNSENKIKQQTKSFDCSFPTHQSKLQQFSQSNDDKVSHVPNHFLDFTDHPIAENTYATTLSHDIMTRNLPDQNPMHLNFFWDSDSFPKQTIPSSQLNTYDFEQWLTSSQNQGDKREMAAVNFTIDQNSSCTNNIDLNSDLCSWTL